MIEADTIVAARIAKLGLVEVWHPKWGNITLSELSERLDVPIEFVKAYFQIVNAECLLKQIQIDGSTHD